MPGAIEQAEGAQIGFVQTRAVVFTADAGEERAEARAVELRHANRALFILEETAVLLSDGRAFSGADAEHQ